MAEKEKQKPNVVHQDAIRVETIKKELRCQKLSTEFNFNPYKKIHVLPDKPLARKPAEVVVDTTEYIDAIHRANMEPTKKYLMPQTESQEIGWWAAPLIPSHWTDRRLDFRRVSTDISRDNVSARLIKKIKDKNVA